LIHYHGTPISPRAQLLRMAGRHFCVSFARDQDLKTCLAIGQSVMFDNGAFSTYTRGERFDSEAFYAWLGPVLYAPHWAVIPDVIGAGVEEQRLMLATWPHRRELGAPVWHMNEPVEYLLELADAWPRICIGSAGEFWQINTPAWCGRMDAAFNALSKRHARLPWIHGLRMLGQAGSDWPLASADSTNVGQNWKRDTGCAECKAASLDAVQTPSTWAPRAEQIGIFE
jgi:hypothetical protein